MLESDARTEVISSVRLVPDIADVTGIEPEAVKRGHAVFDVPLVIVSSLSVRFEIGSILDRYWIITDPDPVENERMIESFFDDLSGSYGMLVDTDRNAANVRHLLWLLLDHIGIPEGPLLDFGCGPGSSRGSVNAVGRQVVGVDLSARMRALAANSGMQALGPDELLAWEGEQFAGCFASYVLHLDPQPEGLRHLVRSLRSGGALVANIHKDRGLETLCAHIESEGCSWELLPRAAPDTHGSYLSVRGSG